MSMELVRKPASSSNDGELDSSSAQTIAGAKTFTGALTPAGGIVGRTDGVAVPAGQVGEVVEVVSNLTNFPVAGTWSDFAAAIQLTAGVWTISYVVDFELNGATMQQISIGIGTASGSSTTGLTAGSSQVGANVPTTQTNASGCIPNFYVRLNSTTLYYGKIFGGYTAGTPRYRGRLTAIRIA